MWPTPRRLDKLNHIAYLILDMDNNVSFLMDYSLTMCVLLSCNHTENNTSSLQRCKVNIIITCTVLLSQLCFSNLFLFLLFLKIIFQLRGWNIFSLVTSVNQIISSCQVENQSSKCASIILFNFMNLYWLFFSNTAKIFNIQIFMSLDSCVQNTVWAAVVFTDSLLTAHVTFLYSP